MSLLPNRDLGQNRTKVVLGAPRMQSAASSNSLTVDVVRTTEGLLALRDEWNALEESAQIQLPFRTFAWNAAWWNTLREDKLSVHDSLELRTVRDSGTGRLIG